MVFPKRRYAFRSSMLNGHPGNVSTAVKRVIVRGVNSGLIVTATTDGRHAVNSYHYPSGVPPKGRAVDLGHRRPGSDDARDAEVHLQRFLIRQFGAHAFNELYGPDNDANVKNGSRVKLGEGTALETSHDTHVHVAPRRALPLPKRTRRQLEAAKAKARHSSNVRVARKHGAHYITWIYEYADKHNVSPALALALFEQETGFENEYGHDRDTRGNIIWHGKTGKVMVTEANYRDYKRWRNVHGLAQGVGPGQLTSPGFQDLADTRGGCWRAEVNIDVSLEILAGHIKALGTLRGVGAYNGGRGNPNMRYAKSVVTLRDRWAARGIK